MQPRKVLIHSLKILKNDLKNAQITLEVSCSKGTYVRSLGRDIARFLGTCGHVSMIHRTKVGIFGLESAILLDKLKDLVHTARLFEVMLPVQAVLDDILVLEISDSSANDLRLGRALKSSDFNIPSDTQTFKAMQGDTLVAIIKAEDELLKPVRVFNY